MLSPIIRLVPETLRRPLREKYLGYKERQRYRFEVRAIDDSVMPGWSHVSIIEDQDIHQDFFVPGEQGDIKRYLRLMPGLRYSRKKRLGWALTTVTVLMERLPKNVPLDLLMIGYGQDTWDAQFLHRQKMDFRAAYLDVSDFNPDEAVWNDTADQVQLEYVQADARDIQELFPDRQFDAVLICRASIDLLPPEDYLSVWSQGLEILKDRGFIVSPIKGLNFAPYIDKAEQHQHLYSTEIGEYHFGSNFGRYIPAVGELGHCPDLLDITLARFIDFARLHEQTHYLELIEATEGTSSDKLRAAAIYKDGKTTAHLWDLNTFPGVVEVVGFDYMHLENKSFNTRTTILGRRG
jgi:hypothetical protein